MSTVGFGEGIVRKYIRNQESDGNNRITQEGEQCLQHAMHILESVQDMENHFGELQGATKGLTD